MNAKILPFIPSSKAPCIDPATSGYRISYRENQVNNCPGCGRSHWYVGRLLAECAFCSTAIPLASRS